MTGFKHTGHPFQISIVQLLPKKKMPIAAVVFLKANGNYTEIHTIDGKNHLVSKTLLRFEEHLCKKTFLRINRSILVNKEYILVQSSKEITLTNGKAFAISRRKRNLIKTILLLGNE